MGKKASPPIDALASGQLATAPAPSRSATALHRATRAEFCVVTCVITLRSLPASGAVGCCRSDTSEGQRHASDPHEHCPFVITDVLQLSLGYSRR